MKIINVGEKFGQFKILSSDRDDGYTKYTCRCLRCGKVFRSGNSTVHKNKDIGCADCVKKEKELREIAEAEKKYLKHEINDLTIIGYVTTAPVKIGKCLLGANVVAVI